MRPPIRLDDPSELLKGIVRRNANVAGDTVERIHALGAWATRAPRSKRSTERQKALLARGCIAREKMEQ